MIAVRVPNWLGDCVMCLPAVEAIAAAEGRENVTVIAKRSVADLFTGYSCMIARSRWDVEPYAAPRARRILLFTNSLSTAMNAWRAGIKERIGYAAHLRSALLTKAVVNPSGKLHQIDEYNTLAAAAGYEVSPAPPKLLRRGRSLIDGTYIVLAPGAKYGSAKRWPQFEELANELASRGKKVVLLGAEGESASYALAPEVIDLIGKTTLNVALDIIASASEVVSNDSGIAHAAAALGRRTVVIFGPTDPVRTAPRGSIVVRGAATCAPCGKRECPTDQCCMTGITVEEVLSVMSA